MTQSLPKKMVRLLEGETGPRILLSLSGLVLALGFHLHRDFGISWDEPQQRTIGQVSLRYVYGVIHPQVTTTQSDFRTFRDRDYGVLFELPAAALESILQIEDSQQIYWVRHLLTFLVFLVGIAAVYLIVERRFKSRTLGLVGAALMLLHPRIFAHAFFNSKDSVFMSMFAVALYALVRLLDRPSAGSAIVAGIAVGLASGVRVVGLGLLLLALIFIALGVLIGEHSVRLAMTSAIQMLTASAATLIAVWPFLWTSPLTNLVQALQNMAQFRWGGSNRYLGELLPASELPWHYTPIWIVATTPLFIILLVAIGIWQTAKALIKSGRLWTDSGSRTDALMVAALVGPILATASLGSVLYDGWRQHQFVFPAMVVLATTGLHVLVKERDSRCPRIAGAILIAVAVSSALTLAWMIRAHPLHNVYFNRLVVMDAIEVFEVDYWGLANRQALEKILETDERPTIYVAAVSDTPLRRSLLVLDPKERGRVVIAGAEDADYIITNYRGVKSPRDQRESLGRTHSQFFEVIIGGHTVLSVYRVTSSMGK